MQVSPRIMGLLSVVVVAGAVSGASIGQTSIKQRGANFDAMPQYEQSFTDAELEKQQALPDHYPLVRQGRTIPVAELRDRGLYSNPRFGRTYYAADLPDAAFYEDIPEPYTYEVPPEPQPAARRPVSLAHAQPLARPQGQPLEIAPPDADGQSSVSDTSPDGDARRVDVGAVLAARR